MSSSPVPIIAKPGIRRDGTRFDNDAHVDGEWARWGWNGKARKIGGFRRLGLLNGIPRGLHTWNRAGETFIHSGSQQYLQQVRVDNRTGLASAAIDRTPASFPTNANHVWQFDALFDSVSGLYSTIVAHATPSALAIDSSDDTIVYYGDLTASAVLAPIQYNGSDLAVSGCVLALHPYLVVGGNDGLVQWSTVGAPGDFDTGDSGLARPTSQKILTGRRTRGTSGPSGLLWSLDSLIRMNFVGDAAVWQFGEISSAGLLSPRSVVEYDGAYYWPGNGRFQVYNGAVREIPNDYNADYFFDNINQSYRGKCFGFANPRHGEIWFCYPHGDATECDRAAILNLRLQTWYDTALPGMGRSCAAGPNVFTRPLMAGLDAVGATYPLWEHEYGVDKLEGPEVRAVRSYFETSALTMLKTEKPDEAAIEALIVEPDFVQTGDIEMTVTGNRTSRSRTIDSEAFEIPEVVTEDNEVIPMEEERRQMRFRFESNEVGGNYQQGTSFVYTKAGSKRVGQ